VLVARAHIEQFVRFQASHLEDFGHRDCPAVFMETGSPLHTFARPVHDYSNPQCATDV
jgi:hypothetical protein